MDNIMGLLELIIMIVMIVVPLFVIKLIWNFLFSGIKRQKDLLAGLEASGFHIDHRLNSNIIVVFDDSRKEIGFVAADELVKVNYGDIISWQWTWTEGNGVRFNNHINFTIKHVDRPLIKIPFGSSSRDAEYWHAKLSAILGR